MHLSIALTVSTEQTELSLVVSFAWRLPTSSGLPTVLKSRYAMC